MDYKPINHEDYKRMCEHASKDPEGFWRETAKSILKWTEDDFSNVIGQIGEESSFWFDGGIMNTCYNAVDRHAAKNPDKIALLYEGNSEDDSDSLTYAQLLDKVSRMANVLLSHGVTKGMTVAIYLPVCLDCIIAMLACARIGAIHTVIFGAFAGDALSFRIRNSGATIVVTGDHYYRAKKPIPMKKTLDHVLDQCPDVKYVFVCQLIKDEPITITNPEKDRDLHELIAKADPQCAVVPMKASDPLFILYTSGSTGAPKGIIHRVGGYTVASTLSFKYVFDADENTVFGCTSDLGWITGHSYVCYGPLLNGVTSLVFGGSPLYPDSTRSWELIQKLKLTHFYTSPSAARAISAKITSVDQVAHFDISSLRVIGSVGETLDADTWNYINTVMGRNKCWIVDTYWQTELGSIIATSVPGVHNLEPGVIGKPLFNTELVLIDAEDHHVIYSTNSSNPPKEEQGLLCVASPWPGLANASYGSDKSFKERYIVEGTHFFSTGDTATIDTKGCIRITGRVDDQLCVNGHRVGPAEVEGAIMNLSDVKDAAVVGIPSKKTAQAIVAFVVANRETPEMKTEVMKAVTDSFSAIGRPQKIYFVKQLPKTNSQKIIRMLLKALAVGENPPIPHTLSNKECVPEIKKAIEEQDKITA